MVKRARKARDECDENHVINVVRLLGCHANQSIAEPNTKHEDCEAVEVWIHMIGFLKPTRRVEDSAGIL
jgi:hypothetical protein